MPETGILKTSQVTALAALLLASAWGDALADTLFIAAAKDGTLIENPTGSLANGAGPALFAGRIASSSQFLRRALLAFDVAAAVPPGSTILGARLTLNVSTANPGTTDVTLYRLVADWGEGLSSATGGGGAAALPGDATWLHRSFDETFWLHPGGDFVPIPSALATVDQVGAYVWGPTAEMTADVQAWLDDPVHAFGWILIGDETRPQTARRFDSRESPDAGTRPVLEIEFAPPCVPFPLGPGEWRRECFDRTAIADFLDCAARRLEDLGFPGLDACDGVVFEAPRGCEARALSALSLVVLNLCAGRVQTSCPMPAEGVCHGETVGERLAEAAGLAHRGDCRRSFACVAGRPGLD